MKKIRNYVIGIALLAIWIAGYVADAGITNSVLSSGLRFGMPLALAAMVGIRAMVLEILTNATDSDWDQVSNHPERGPVTLSELFEKADGHIVGHTQQLREIAGHFN